MTFQEAPEPIRGIAIFPAAAVCTWPRPHRVRGSTPAAAIKSPRRGHVLRVGRGDLL
jgi:hypothetical protein